jgi:hypothetical protein
LRCIFISTNNDQQQPTAAPNTIRPIQHSSINNSHKKQQHKVISALPHNLTVAKEMRRMQLQKYYIKCTSSSNDQFNQSRRNTAVRPTI